MLKVSKELFELLSTSEVFSSVVGKRIYPVVAGEGVDYPFSIYTLSRGLGTYDGDEYNVYLHTYFSPNKIAEAMTFADNVKELICGKFQWEGDDIDFIDKDQSIVVSIFFKTIG
ncbi:hypothetical protein HX049_07985 [Myroides odoratimimus]|uniref:hypothetical protein n=1 Tax=Myroides odoratimimus TaxID=76832 RepID=UPI00257506CD|nr:hypothetical protein [Myroides odoratimimus]MDM1397113.1 hypothetical protein [Myroides odoratimimus]